MRGDMDSVLDAWLERFEASQLRLPGAVERAALRHLVTPTAVALADGLDDAEPVRPGAAALREAEKELSFLGEALAAQRATVFDGSALIFALRDALSAHAADDAERARLAALFDWFVSVLGEGVARGHRGAVFERMRELLEERSPVVLAGPEIPAAFPIGDADAHGLRGALARLMMSIARVGARAVVVDASGLTGADSPSVLSALREYCSHRKIRGSIALIVCGLEGRAERAWCDVAREFDVELHLTEGFQHALQVAARC